MLDSIFGALPAKAKLTPVAKTEPKAAQRLKVIDMNVPQSVARFGLPAMARKDKDFMAAFVLNTILGGGFTSRLYQEVREKRGLAYGVDTSIDAAEECVGVHRQRRHQERGDRPVAGGDPQRVEAHRRRRA